MTVRKTEDPSGRRLAKAAEEGQVLKSQDMNVFTGLFGALLLMFAVPMIYNRFWLNGRHSSASTRA